MRKLLSMLFLAVFLFMGIIGSAQAQSGAHPVAAGKFDVRFTVKNLDCSVSPKTLTIAVQVKSKTMADTFLMGDANYRFRFKTTQLRLLGTNPTYSQSLVSQENFSSAASSPNRDFNYGTQNLNGSGEGPTEGIVSLNTFYSGSNQGGKLVTTTWTTVACIKFSVITGPSECFDLTWNTNNDFPVTGMNEVYNLVTDPSYDYKQENVAAGGYFGNVNQCAGTYCSPILAVNDINITLQNTAVSGQVLTNDIGSGLVVTTTPIANPANGTVVLNANGTYTYTPTTGFSGTDSFKYKICDNLTPQKCDTALVTISIIPPVITGQNAPPVAQNDTKQTFVGVPVSGSVLSNDFDPNTGQTLTVTTTPVTPPVNGTVVLNANGTYTYTPSPGFSGADSFTYKVCDNGSPVLCSNATVYLDIVPKNTPATANDKPNAGDDAGTTPKNVAITGTLNTNDSDPNAGQILAYTTTPILAPAHGTVTITSTGGYTYTPTTGYTGSDAFTYKVCDNGTPVLCDTATVYLTVTALPNNSPVLSPPTTTPVILEDATTPITFCVTYSDADANDTHTPTICGVLNGTATIASQNTTSTPKQVCFTYKPNPNFSGTDSVCVKVCDNNGACSTIKVPITVTPVADAPMMNPLVSVVPEDTTVAVKFCYPVIDPDAGDIIQGITVCGAPLHASTFSYNTDNVAHTVCVSYKPQANYVGKDTVCLKICDSFGLCTDVKFPILVVERPDAPVVLRTPQLVGQNSPIVPLCLPIIDPDAGDTHTVTICGVPKNGTATPTVNNVTHEVCLNYKPTANFAGKDSVCITICDSYGKCINVTIPITVSLNTPPTLGTLATTPTVPEDGGSVTVCLPITDPDATDTHTVTPCGALNGTVTYSVNNLSSPHQVCATYTPNPNFNGTDSICVKVCDNFGNCVVKKIPVTVTPTNDPPVVLPVATTLSEDGITTVCLPVTDPDANDLHSVTMCAAPKTGTASLTVNNAVTPHQVCITYTPLPNFNGKDTVCVRVCDAAGVCTDVKVPFVVTPVNDAPIAKDDIVNTPQGMPVVGNVLTNDVDPDGNPLTVTGPLLGGLPTKGTVVMSPTGVYTYTPNPTATGTDTFKYKVCDNGTPSLCDTAVVIVTITPVTLINGTNLPPIASPDITSTPKDKPLIINVLANDGDPEGLPLNKPTILTPPTKGTVVVNPDGTITYTPNPGVTGDDTFTYQVCDTGSPVACTSQTVTVTVLPLLNVPSNDPPVPTDDAKTMNKNGILTTSVATNDTDPNAGQLLTYSNTSSPVNGTLLFNPNGTFTYVPMLGFVGSDSFTYKVCDNGSPVMCSNATVYLTIIDPTVTQPANTLPIALDDNSTTPKGVAVVIPVKANDTYTAGILGNPTAITTPLNGSVITNANGTMTYTPTANFVGIDTYKYKICDASNPTKCDTAVVTITIKNPVASVTAIVNNPPVAIDDQKITTKNTATIGATVAANDSDPDAGQTLSYTKLTNPTNGSITFNADGTYTYTPNANFVGTDAFTYKVCDSFSPSLCANATAYITILDKPCITLELKVFLQGPYNQTTGLMNTTLNQRGLLPGQTPVGIYALPTVTGHPYSGLPFSYAGTEKVTSYASDIVDWVLVSLRSNLTLVSKIFTVPGLLHSDGTITFVNSCMIIPNGSYYILIEHRNHTGIMSPTAIPITTGKISFDFTTQQSFQLTNPPSFGQRAIGTKFAMFAGDGKKVNVNDNFDINFNDSQLWRTISGGFDVYLLGDFNMDADTNFGDNSLWKTNSGKFSGVQH